MAAPSTVAIYEAPLHAHNSPTIVLQDDDLWLDDNRGTVDDDVEGWSCDDENFVSPLTKSPVRCVILNQCGKGARQTWDIVPACANNANIATRIRLHSRYGWIHIRKCISCVRNLSDRRG